ncbi:hypothetical protein ACF08O_31450 [Streptomyces paradoxus]|uniref:hypothetical protein n=1 Tax=Streptomyces paradoxus TaxID=66375 RepID=UPI003702FF8F
MPLSAGRTRLYDGEQVDAYLAGRAVPELPAADDDKADADEDLLDRQEAAALRGIDLSAWDRCKKDPAVHKHMVLVDGVEHWPRRIVRDHDSTPRRRAGTGGGGRPAGVGDQVPRDQLPARVAQLLDDDPTLTAAGVAERLGVHRNTAQAALTALRAQRMADVMEQRGVTAAQAAELKFLPVVSERARAKLNQMAARKTRPPKQSARPLAQLRAWWKASAILTSGVAVGVINSLLECAIAAAAATRVRVAAVVDVALAAVDVTATVFVMNEGGRFHRRHLLAEARRHLALVLRGRRRDPSLDDRIVAAAISTHCLDISEPKTARGLESGYRLYTARWALPDFPARRRPPAPAPGPDRQPPVDPSEPAAPRPPGQDAGEWEIPRIPLQYERAVLAGAVVREKLRTATAVRGRAYDVVAHQQAAMPEQLLAPPAAEVEHDYQQLEVGRREAVDMTALRALRESRTDVEALDLTAERLRHLQDAFTKAADDSRVRADGYTEQDDVDVVRPVREDDQQAYRPQEPGPHRGREAGH